jgi:hypothetical protein
MKEWFQQNRWLGTFLIASGAAMLIALILLWFARSTYEEAFARLKQAVSEKNRLEHLDPFPNQENYRNMQNLIGVYNLATHFAGGAVGAERISIALAPGTYRDG